MPRASNVAARREMTLEEWAALDGDVRGELVDGVLEEEEVPTTLHEALLSWLMGALRAYLRPRKGWIFGSEHKVVEILSGSAGDVRRDRVQKLVDYQTAGVRHYWIVDPVAVTLEIFELRPGKKPRLALVASDGVHAIPGCPGLKLDLDDLRDELAALPEDEPPPPPSSRPKKRRSRSLV